LIPFSCVTFLNESGFVSGVQQELLQGLAQVHDGEGKGEDPGLEQVRLHRDQRILQKGAT